MRILFITSNRIGDAVLTTGVLDHLLTTHPEARFTIACGPVTMDLFRAVPRVDTIITLKKKKRCGHWLDLWRACVLTHWDLIVDLRNSFITRLMWADKKVYKRARNSGHHKVEDHGFIFGLEPPPSPKIWLDTASIDQACHLVAQDKVALALGPSANWPAKQWDAGRFAALAEKLTSTDGPLAGAPILLLAAEHERAQLDPLFKKLPPSQIIDLVGLDLLTAAACLKRARLFIGNDSGLTHMAAAVGTPTVALFGPGWENIYGPWGPNTAVVRKEKVEDLLARLPYPGAFAPNLMGSIEVDDVYNAALKLLEKTTN